MPLTSSKSTHYQRDIKWEAFESSVERRDALLSNLAREMPLASQRIADNLQKRIDIIRSFFAAGGNREEILTVHPELIDLKNPDPRNTFLHCLFLSADEHRYEALSGIPLPVLQLYEFICEKMRNDDAYVARTSGDSAAVNSASMFATGWMMSIAPGADLGLLLTRFVSELMHDMAVGARALSEDPVLLAALDRVAALHHRILTDDPPERAEWKLVRTELMNHADRTCARERVDSIDTALFELAENAARDCSRSDVVGEEIVERAVIVRALARLSAPNLSSEERASVDALDALAEQADRRAADEMRARPEVKSALEKLNAYHQQMLGVRSEIRQDIAGRLITLTRGFY